MNATDDPMSCTLNAINAFVASDAALPLKLLAVRIGASWPAFEAVANAEDEFGYAWSSIGKNKTSSCILVGFDHSYYTKS